MMPVDDEFAGLLARTREALRRLKAGLGAMRIPADPADGDLVLSEWLDAAPRLLRERDEWMEAFERFKESNERISASHSEMHATAMEYMRERDEARAEVAEYEARDECQVDGRPACHGPGKTEVDWCRACLVAEFRKLRGEAAAAEDGERLARRERDIARREHAARCTELEALEASEKLLDGVHNEAIAQRDEARARLGSLEATLLEERPLLVAYEREHKSLHAEIAGLTAALASAQRERDAARAELGHIRDQVAASVRAVTK